MSILDLERKQKKREKRIKFLIKRIGRKQKEKILNQKLRESKKKENSQSRIERKQKKYAEKSLDQTISEQYRIVTK